MLDMIYKDSAVESYGDKIGKERLMYGMTQREDSAFKNILYSILLKYEYVDIKFKSSIKG